MPTQAATPAAAERSGRSRAPGVVLAVLGTLTWHQTQIYKDQETLWRDTLYRNPTAWIAHSNLSEILVAKGELVEAMAHCRAALELKPDQPKIRKLVEKYRPRVQDAVTFLLDTP